MKDESISCPHCKATIRMKPYVCYCGYSAEAGNKESLEEINSEPIEKMFSLSKQLFELAKDLHERKQQKYAKECPPDLRKLPIPGDNEKDE
jgi:hypothetical protein